MSLRVLPGYRPVIYVLDVLYVKDCGKSTSQLSAYWNITYCHQDNVMQFTYRHSTVNGSHHKPPVFALLLTKADYLL